MRPGKRRALDKSKKVDASLARVEQLYAGIRTKVEHPVRVIKRQFEQLKMRHHRLKKNTAQLAALFTMSIMWMGCKTVRMLGGHARPKVANAA